MDNNPTYKIRGGGRFRFQRHFVAYEPLLTMLKKVFIYQHDFGGSFDLLPRQFRGYSGFPRDKINQKRSI